MITYKKEYPNKRDCKHGQLARSCPFCELAQEIESLCEERDEWKRRAERASVLATKHCPRDHHDWQEICTTVNHWFEEK